MESSKVCSITCTCQYIVNDPFEITLGEYRVELPDGRTQIVTYHADHENGFVADVRYEGEAIPYVADPHKPPPPQYHHAPNARQ